MEKSNSIIDIKNFKFYQYIIYHIVIKAVDIAINKALNQKLGLNCCRPIFINKNLLSNIWNIYKN